MDVSSLLDRCVRSLEEITGSTLHIGFQTSDDAASPSEASPLYVRQSGVEWTFHPIAHGRLSKERAAQYLSKVRDETNTGFRDGTPLLVTPHVTSEGAKLLRKENVCYLDSAGNCYLADEGLFTFIQGQKSSAAASQDRPGRAFNASGLKLIFLLLVEKDAVNTTYRDLSQLSGISRGAVGYVIQNLETLGFIEKSGRKRWLRNERELTDRWVAGYAETLRPELSRGRFRFVSNPKPSDWKKLVAGIPEMQWGGEVGADLLTGNLRPEKLTIYTHDSTSAVCKELRAIPDEEGPIEILDAFWPFDQLETVSDLTVHVPPLLVYADLIAEADPRGLEVARLIRDEHLEI